MNRLILIILILLPVLCYAAPKQSPTATVTPVKEVNDQSRKQLLTRLDAIQKRIDFLNNEIISINQKIDDASAVGIQEELIKELTTLQDELKEARDRFISTAAEVELQLEVPVVVEKKATLSEEFRDILSPLLASIRKLSERPREIQDLKEQKAELEFRLNKLIRAEENIRELLQTKLPPNVKKTLKTSLNRLQADYQELEIRLDSISRRLDERLKAKESLWEKFVGFIKGFLSTAGRDLLLSLILFIATIWLLLSFRKRLFRSKYFRHELVEFLQRPLFTLYGILAFIVAMILAIILLYLLNYWILVTIIILLLTSTLWSLKQYAPRFVEEIRLIFNLGPVREGQRLIWQGIPWQVIKVGYYTTLRNELLQGRTVRVTAHEILKLHSRIYAPNEPWFPCRRGDWILLKDGTYGQVDLQTPEQVILRLAGGSRKFYRSAEFITSEPQNLSDGFFLSLIFGLDYGVQKNICEKIPRIFTEKLKSKLASYFDDKHLMIKNFEVTFHSAGESSLNLWVKGSCHGNLAHKYLVLPKQFNHAMVEICNEEGLTIPFNQLTVHMPSGRTDE